MKPLVAIALKGGGAQMVSLRAANGDASVVVDEAAGLIKNAAVITAGMAYPCNAEPFVVDATTLENVRDAINNAASPVRCRMTHPEVEGQDGIGWTVGTIFNARIDGEQVRADVQIGDYAAKSPNGDMRAFLLGMAKDNPTALGLSIVFGDGSLDEIGGRLVGRIRTLFATDFVGEPAANPAGLLKKAASAPGAAAAVTPPPGTKDGKAMKYSAAQIAYLQTIGLPVDATEEQIAAFVAGITPEQTSQLEASLAAAAAAPAKESKETEAVGAAASANAARIALANDRTRLSAIRELGTIAGKDGEWALNAHTSGKTLDAIRTELSAERAKAKQPVALGGSVGVGDDRGRVALGAALRDAVTLRAGTAVEKPHELTNKFRYLRTVDIARRFLSAYGIDADAMPDMKVAKLVMNRNMLRDHCARISLTLGDYGGALGVFSGILGDSANRGLLQGYGKRKLLWPKFARKHVCKDFKEMDRAAFGALTLAQTTAGHDVTYAALGDRKEVYSLKKWTGGTAFTWEQIINDDLSAIGGVQDKFGFLAAQKEDAVAFGVITANAAMADTYAIFQAANHVNYTASGTAISATSIGVGISQMMAQTDAGAASTDALDIMPGVLLCAPAKLAVARQNVYGQYDPNAALGASAVNPWQGDLEVISSGYLTGNAWYLIASPGTPGESFEVAFLEGAEEPMMESEEDFDSATMKMKVTHTVASTAIDYRGAYKNAGA